MTRVATWLGGPLDGELVELARDCRVYEHVELVGEIPPVAAGPLPLTEGATYRTVAVPVRRYRDGRYWLVWGERTPRTQ